MRPSFEDLQNQLDEWIAEGGELAKVVMRAKKRLTRVDDYAVLVAEINNIGIYFRREKWVGKSTS